MIKNYLKIALRTLRRHKGYTFINVGGLAVGLACCLLIVLYVQHERSYDHFHTNADRIYRVEMDMHGTQQTTRWSVVPVPAAPILKEQFPDVEHVARIGTEDEPLIQYGTHRFFEDFFYSTEPAFFDIFDFPLLKGSASDLARPNTIILSESIAQKYFGEENPMGHTVTKVNKWTQEVTEYEVVGVMADPPANSHFHPHLLASLETSLQGNAQNWRRIAYTYVLLRDGIAPEALARQFTPITDLVEANLNSPATAVLMPLLRIHLHHVSQDDLEPQGDIRYIWIFSAIAFLILLIACINYMNLATARAAQRAKEVGVRKVVGALRRQLAAQFIGEAVIQTTLALVLGLSLAQLMLPAFNELMQQPLALDLGNGWVIVALAATALMVGLASGSYPALVLSGYRPASVLKGNVQTHHRSSLRKGLVVFQFTVTAALIACTVVIQRQLYYVQHTRLGFDKEEVVIISARNTLGTDAAAFKQALLQHPTVRHVSLAAGVPGQGYAITFYEPDQIEAYAGADEGSIVFDHLMVDEDYLATLGLELVDGRNFSPDFPSDAEEAYLVNETAVHALGWEDAVGKTFTAGDNKKTVIGVFRDFHMRSMKEEIRPMLLQLHTSPYHVAVKLATADLSNTLAHLKATWEQFVPAQPFEYSFLDDDFAAMYRAEQRLGRLFSVFAGLAIFVACLGLFGLAAFTAEQRTKEIGIRKVLGASVHNLVALLSKDLLKLVLVAIVLAVPVTYVAMQRWLADFAYRIEISWPIFLMAGLAALGVALLTVSYQAIKAALADPVKSLRYE